MEKKLTQVEVIKMTKKNFAKSRYVDGLYINLNNGDHSGDSDTKQFIKEQLSEFIIDDRFDVYYRNAVRKLSHPNKTELTKLKKCAKWALLEENFTKGKHSFKANGAVLYAKFKRSFNMGMTSYYNFVRAWAKENNYPMNIRVKNGKREIIVAKD